MHKVNTSANHPSHWVLFLGLVLPLLCSSFGAPAKAAGGQGKVFLTQEEALALAFPKCEIERQRVYLSKEEAKQVDKLAKTGVEPRVVYSYVAYLDGKLQGTAYFDGHKVRTLRETLMIVVDPKDKITRVEVLSFGEPQDYIPRGSWYAQFKGKGLGDKLDLKGSIRGVTGATLTAVATTQSARRVLACHDVLQQRAAAATP